MKIAEKIYWPENNNELTPIEQVHKIIPTPFNSWQKNRPLRLTYHISGLKDIKESEKEALKILYEFSRDKTVEAIQTEKGDFFYIEMGEIDESIDIQLFSIKYSDSMVESCVHLIGHLLILAQQLTQINDLDAAEVKECYSDLILARAHHAIKKDIFVTNSKWLLGNRQTDLVKLANPRTPSETLKILGLLLRSRNDYRYSAKEAFDRGLFYWVLTRYRLPSMWKYFSACVQCNNFHKDDIGYLGESILTRCVRALQACDEIGRLYYADQNNNTRDETMYHFDYLTILLSGAFDAEARVANRTYQITEPNNERNVSFNRKEFKQALKKVDSDLASFVYSDYSRDIRKVVSLLRNTIHGANLKTMAFRDGFNLEESLIQIPETDSKEIWDICEKHGSAENWGLLKLANAVMIEPYTFSLMLIENTLKIIDNIAHLTQVEKLFPAEVIGSLQLDCSPEEDGIFNSKVGERLELLA